MRIIDADELENRLLKWLEAESPNTGELPSKEYWTVSECIREVRNTPTIAINAPNPLDIH